MATDAERIKELETKLSELEPLKLQLVERDKRLADSDTKLSETTKAVISLQAANKTFAEQVTDYAIKLKSLPEYEQRIKTLTDAEVVAKAELAKRDSIIKATEDNLLGIRRANLIKLGVPEDKVKTLDKTALDVMDLTLPYLKVNPNGKGLDLGSNRSDNDIIGMTEQERMRKYIDSITKK